MAEKHQHFTRSQQHREQEEPGLEHTSLSEDNINPTSQLEDSPYIQPNETTPTSNSLDEQEDFYGFPDMTETPTTLSSCQETPRAAHIQEPTSGETSEMSQLLAYMKQMTSAQNQITNQITSLEKKFDNKLDISQSQITHRISDLEMKLSTTVKEIREELRSSLNQMEVNLQEAKNTCQATSQRTKTEIHQLIHTKIQGIQEVQHEMKKEILQQKETSTILIDELTKSTLLQKDHILEECEIKCQNVKATLDHRIEEVERIQQQRPHPGNTTQEIFVTCLGSYSTSPDHTFQKFNGKANNPKEYLDKMDRMFMRNQQRRQPSIVTANEMERVEEIADMCLEGHAAKWWQLNKDDIESWDEFKDAFTEKYWSREVQRGIKQRMERERYRPGGRLTRAEYFVERVLTLKHMTPALQEEEMVTLLAEHYSDIIQDAMRVQNITTVRDFELLLQREDIQDGNRNIRDFHSRPITHPQMPRQREQPFQRPQQFNFRATERPRREERPNNHYNSNPPRRTENSHNYHSTNRPFKKEPYPSHEQQQVCSAIIERTPQRSNNTPKTESMHLQQNQPGNGTLN